MNPEVASSSSHDSAKGPVDGTTAIRWSGTKSGSHRRATGTRHRRLRLVYFILASAWGFAAGTVAVFAGFRAIGRPVHFDSSLGVTLGFAGAIAIVGGVIFSLAYREAVRRGG